MVSFFGWWYGPGWAGVIKSLQRRLKAIIDEFSVVQLLRTLFAPWRRIITYPGRSLAERWHASLDNLFSRCIGFIVRLFVLFAALIFMAIVVVLSIVQIIVWPLVPLAVLGAIIVGLL